MSNKRLLPIKEIASVMRQRGYEEKQLRAYSDCGSDYYRIACTDSPGISDGHGMLVTNHCNSRICPVCAAIQGRRVRKRYSKSISSLARRKPKHHSLSLLTLTQRLDRNIPLKERIRKIKRDLKRFLRQAYPTEKGCHGVYTLEAGANGMVHIHAIVFGPATSSYKLKNRWHKITGDSYIVDIKPISGERAKILEGAVAYILKYISKVPRFDSPEEYVDYLEALQGARRLGTWGDLYGVKLRADRTPCRCPICGGALFFAGLLVDGEPSGKGIVPSGEFQARLAHALALLDLQESLPAPEASCKA